jgi:glycerophosphoryl diester phosphodiesterase
VEVDVREASDGTPILLHDATLSRVHGREERADRLSPGDLAALGVPTLAGALAAVSRASFVNVEMKGDFGSAVVEVLEEHRGANPARTVISSFSPAALDRVRSARPGWRLWLNVEQLTAGSIRVARELGSVGVSAGWPSIDREVVDLARQAGLHVAAWTVTDSVAFERLSEVGVDAICAEANALWP